MSNSENSDQIISIIEENRSEKLHIALKEYKSRHYLDIRTYIEPYADESQGRQRTPPTTFGNADIEARRQEAAP